MDRCALPISERDVEAGEMLFTEFLQSYAENSKDPMTLCAGDVKVSYTFESDQADAASAHDYDMARVLQFSNSVCPLLLREVECSRRRAAERKYPKHGVLTSGLEIFGTAFGFAAILGLIGLLGGLCALYFGVFLPFQMV